MLPEAEPILTTSADCLSVLAELESYEPIFHRSERGTTRSDFEAMTVDDFWEVGASGQRYGRSYVLDLLERRAAMGQTDVLEASDLYCRKLADEVYLLTYNLIQDKVRYTRRTTIGQRTTEGWKIVFHQGTMVAGGEFTSVLR